MKSALIDASSAILLFKAQLFDEVSRAYDLRVVPAVLAELTVAQRAGSSTFGQAFRGRGIWRQDHPPDAGHPLAASMGVGERDTLLAYSQGASDFVIIDDGKGARVCRADAIPHINALLCPKILYLAGHIEPSLCEAAFERLRRIGRYSAKVIEYARTCTPDMLADFYPHPLPLTS